MSEMKFNGKPSSEMIEGLANELGLVVSLEQRGGRYWFKILRDQLASGDAEDLDTAQTVIYSWLRGYENSRKD